MHSDELRPYRAAFNLLPFFTLACILAGVFLALTWLLPPLLERNPGSQVGLARILPFLTAHPFETVTVLLLVGGALCFLPLGADPLRLTAWFLGAAFVLLLWGTLLVLLPGCSSSPELLRP